MQVLNNRPVERILHCHIYSISYNGLHDIVRVHEIGYIRMFAPLLYHMPSQWHALKKLRAAAAAL